LHDLQGYADGQRRFTREEYIETYRDIAIEEMRTNGIPASIKLAQGILESGFGNSDPGRSGK
jgi:flagellum-specific peptidoglycan hydrolase FlgJ